MLDQSGFDLWADGYDKTVGISDEENAYPFAGYRDVLGSIFQTIMEKPNATVLDIGFGTATLTAKLYEHGCTIYGQDFSSRMIALASGKMPGSHLYQGGFIFLAILSFLLISFNKRLCYVLIIRTYFITVLPDCLFQSSRDSFNFSIKPFFLVLAASFFWFRVLPLSKSYSFKASFAAWLRLVGTCTTRVT